VELESEDELVARRPADHARFRPAGELDLDAVATSAMVGRLDNVDAMGREEEPGGQL
jgi:hypothetical protein